jgi:hypothetical protein
MRKNFDRYEVLSLVEEAQASLQECIDKLEEYVRATGDKYTDAYIVDHLKIMVRSDHGFMARDHNLGEVIEGLLHPEEDDGEEPTPETLQTEICEWAAVHAEEYRDEVGDVNLTHLEQAVIEHFRMDDDAFEDEDYSFAIWKHLHEKQLV